MDSCPDPVGISTLACVFAFAFGPNSRRYPLAFVFAIAFAVACTVRLSAVGLSAVVGRLGRHLQIFSSTYGQTRLCIKAWAEI
jgi:uncharacterized membrane protein YjjB (DUF3815 family)